MAVFNVFQDFVNYGRGIYVQTSNVFLGVHAVKIVGWGWDRIKKVNYWIVANSWGPNWGNKGYFNIQMGECSFEQSIYTCET